ncbi:carboxypeptidase regulatory-like domain-containing protein [Stackebrandtia albiflava]|uniref:carboxypeptidase regulatory-like domain-containing protein n=1 Tax=Stackebrandtia albiflava TaxID=406432 RepID=UPI0031EB72EF
MNTTTQHRARPRRWLRVAAVTLAGLVAAVAPVTAVPAHADPVGIQVTISPNPAQAKVGQSGTSVTITLTNTSNDKPSDNVQAQVGLTGVEQHADFTVNQGSCQSVQGNSVSCGALQPRAAISFTVDVVARSNSTLAPDQTANGTLSVSISPPNSGNGSGTVTIIGAAQTAPSISGKVVDIESGDPVEGVKVTAVDSKGASFEATTDSGGMFTINQQIAAGEVKLTYTKEGFETREETKTAVAGLALNADARLTTAASDEESPAEESPSPTPEEVAAEEDGGFGTLMWVLIILGALLVIGGIVAIVMLVRKGKRDDDDDDLPPLPDVPSVHRPTATQTGRLGVYDAAPRRPGMDAPTMIHSGPLVNDDDLARYGQEPGSGFGPSYDDRATRQMDPGGADATRMYPTSGAGQSGHPTSGPGAGYPTSGPGVGYPTSGPGAGYPTSGAGQGADATRMYPTSGAGQSGHPTSGPGAGYPTSGPGAGYPTSGAGQGGYPTSGAPGGSWGDRRDPSPPAQQGGWGAPQGDQRHDGGWGRGYDEPASYGGQAQGQGGQDDDWSRFGARNDRPQDQGPQGDWGDRRQDEWGRGGDDRQPRQRRYGDEGYDDRPQSW